MCELQRACVNRKCRGNQTHCEYLVGNSGELIFLRFLRQKDAVRPRHFVIQMELPGPRKVPQMCQRLDNGTSANFQVSRHPGAIPKQVQQALGKRKATSEDYLVQ